MSRPFGLKRRGFSKEVLLSLRRAYKVIYRQGLTTEQALEELQQQFADIPEVQPLIESLKHADRGIIR